MEWGTIQYAGRERRVKRGPIWTAVFLALLFGGLVWAVQADEVQSFDKAAGDFFFDMRTGALETVMKGFDVLGTTEAYAVVFVISAILLLLNRYVRETVMLAVSGAAAWGLNTVIKNGFARERPDLWERLADADGYSFPSANAMVSIALYGFLAWLLLGSRSGWLRVCGILVIIVIALIGVSRLYMGVHYTSDILGGFLAGGMVLALSIAAARRA